MKKKILIVLMIVVVVGALVFTLAACNKGMVADYTAISIDMGNEYFIGTEGSVDLKKIFPNASTFSATGNISVSGTTATASKSGTGTLTVDGVEKTVTVIDGVNATDYAGMKAGFEAEKDVVLQTTSFDLDASATTLHFKNSLYGNGCKINANALVSNDDGSHFLMAEGTNMIIRDLHVSGRDMKEEDNLRELEGYGILLAFEGTVKDVVTATLEHCIFENGHKILHFQASEVDVVDTVVRNASDSTYSIRTADNMGSEIAFKGKNFISGSITAGITVYGYEGIDPSNGSAFDYNLIDIEGDLAMYTWREISSITLMPGTESAAGLVNPLITSNLKKKEYAQFMYEDGGERYIHFAILFLSTNKTNECKHILNGYESINFEKREFPMPSIASKFMNTCDVFGYTTADDIVKPGAQLTQDPRLEGLFNVAK